MKKQTKKATKKLGSKKLSKIQTLTSRIGPVGKL